MLMLLVRLLNIAEPYDFVRLMMKLLFIEFVFGRDEALE